jgi:N-methylhydantoinase B
VLLETPGGGGYGDPLDRPAEQVMDDLRLGYISAQKAAGDYGLVLDAGGGLDASATEKQRAKMRQGR